MMDWPDLAGEPAGSIFSRAIYVVNDNAAAYPSLTVAWQVLGAGDAVLAAGTITCAAPANSLQQVGEVTWDNLGHPRRVRQLSRITHPRTRRRTPGQQRLHHTSPRRSGLRGLSGRERCRFRA